MDARLQFENLKTWQFENQVFANIRVYGCQVAILKIKCLQNIRFYGSHVNISVISFSKIFEDSALISAFLWLWLASFPFCLNGFCNHKQQTIWSFDQSFSSFLQTILVYSTSDQYNLLLKLYQLSMINVHYPVYRTVQSG